jgi:serine/threonine protein kinase
MRFKNITTFENRCDIFYAYDNKNNNNIVIKIVNQQEKDTLDKLKKENLNNVVKIYDTYEPYEFYNDILKLSECQPKISVQQNKLYYISNCTIIMERLNICTEEYLENGDNNINFFSGLKKALEQIHSKDIYHGDLKLKNIGYINNIVKLFDFGNCSVLKNMETDLKDYNSLIQSYKL